jgi:predicted nucleotidyltransferase component of viral defense system
MAFDGSEMKNTIYFKQAKLLLQVLPFIEKTGNFALKGGTAINLFIRDMPRLSVDIDLTYIPLNSREEALADISKSLQEIAVQTKRFLGAEVEERGLKGTDKTVKLLIRQREATIKVEPNLVLRGSVFPHVQSVLRPKAEEMFELSVSSRLLPLPDLFGGKICAALDRQHPRDLFDVQLLLENEGLQDETRKAFIVYLAGHDRPMHELLKPKWKDLRPAFDAEFSGMTLEPIGLDQLVETREKLLRLIHDGLTHDEKKFLLSLKVGEPEWELLGLAGIERLPGLRWKLENVRQMDPKKRREQSARLHEVLDL